MIDRANVLPLTRQAKLLRLSRRSVYALPRPVPPARPAIMHRIDALHTEHPFAGAQMLRDLLRMEGIRIGHLAVAMWACPAFVDTVTRPDRPLVVSLPSFPGSGS